ncbi:tho complex subunit 7 [Cyclospora cayetanensis]|uniref:Tho complex subunit 7 n=1 Tax=Cyclospora cayetanensis TaxID=88456 RepID=A0A1D3D669_9EIME|nr:tho complex subunit 7 [Cyclospora cayetanensis]
MEGRWMGGASGAPPRASPLHQKQPPFQQQKDREGEMRQTLCEWGKGGLQWGTLRDATAKQHRLRTPQRVLPQAKGAHKVAPQGPPEAPMPQAQLPLQTEEEFLRGCGFQAIWSEHFEVSGLMSAAVKLCKLAPTEGDEEWNEALLGFHQMLGLCRARLGRHLCLLQSRLQDVQDVLQMEEEIQSRIKLLKSGIGIARDELSVVKMMKTRREELDAKCSQVLEQPCLRETTKLERQEEERRRKAASASQNIAEQITVKKRQVEAAIKASEDLLEQRAVEAVAE